MQRPEALEHDSLGELTLSQIGISTRSDRCHAIAPRASRSTTVALLLALAILIYSTAAQAIYPYTDAEYAMLPEYCHQQGNVSTRHRPQPLSPRWQEYLGSDYAPIHHWCAVYMWMGRAYRAGPASPQGKQFVKQALSDLTFFVDRARPTSPLLPEVYTRLGEISLLQGNQTSAEAAFLKAREHNPTYWRSYLLWGQYLYSKGKLAEALEVAQAGLEASPNSRALESLIMDINKKTGARSK